MLGNTVYVGVVGEGNVQSNSLRSSWLGVGVSTKGLIPPGALVLGRLGGGLLGSTLLAFLFLFLNLGPPVLQVEKAAVIELDLGLSVTLEVDGQGRVMYDSLKLAARTIDDLGHTLVSLGADGSTGADIKTTNDGPLLGFIVTLLASLAVMAELDVALLPLLLIESEPSGAGLQEGQGKWQADLVVIIDLLEDCSGQLALVEGDGGGVEGVGRLPGGGQFLGIIGKGSVALTEAGLAAGLEILVFDGRCVAVVSQGGRAVELRKLSGEAAYLQV